MLLVSFNICLRAQKNHLIETILLSTQTYDMADKLENGLFVSIGLAFSISAITASNIEDITYVLPNPISFAATCSIFEIFKILKTLKKEVCH